MKEIIDKNGHTITGTDNIKEEVSNYMYYQQLYRSQCDPNREVAAEEFLNIDVQLNENDRNSCEGPVTLGECAFVLNSMKNRKSPGSDGFPAEFYKFLWPDIGVMLLRSIRYSFDNGALSNFQNQGIITCIPKDSRDRRYLKNWRPITLLNVDYKIASGVIANRIKNVLPNIISETQTGFLKNRFIGENTRILFDIIN